MIKFCRIFFIIFVLGLLTVPLFHMNTAEITDQENRTLAGFPKIIQNGKVNKNYGSGFEKWLNDRFWGRDKLIHLYEKAQFINRVVRNKKALYFKENGWMFNFIPKILDISEEKVSETVKRIQKFNRFCSDRGIKLYILLVPKKEMIYSEKFNEYLYDPQKPVSNYLSSIAEIEKRLGPMIVFPYRELKNGSKKDFVFFKETHHWTEYGAFLGYMKLMDSIKRDFKNVKIVSLNDYRKTLNKKIRDDWGRNFNTGHTTRLLHIKPDYAEKHILKTNYTYYDPLKEIVPKILDVPGYKTKSFENLDPKVKYKVFLSGFSSNENLLQFLPYSFSEVKYYRLRDTKNVTKADEKKFLKRYKKDLLEYKPDILILTISVGNIFSKELWEV